MPLLPVLAMVWGTARTTAAATLAAGVVVRHPLDRRLGAGRPAADRRDLAGRHPRRVVGADRTADAERVARVRRRAGRACDRRRDRGRVAGRPAAVDRLRRCRGGCPTRCRAAVAGVLALLGLSGAVTAAVAGRALVDDARTVRDHRLGVRAVQPDGAVGAVRAERDRRHVRGRGRVQRPCRAGDVQFVHGVRRRHSRAAGAGRGADAAAGPGLGGAADRRGRVGCGGRPAVRATAAAAGCRRWASWPSRRRWPRRRWRCSATPVAASWATSATSASTRRRSGPPCSCGSSAIGALTVAMAGGIARRVKVARAPVDDEIKPDADSPRSRAREPEPDVPEARARCAEEPEPDAPKRTFGRKSASSLTRTSISTKARARTRARTRRR